MSAQSRTRIESSVTSVSWIPLEAVTGTMKVPFEAGISHYDLPPPDLLEDLGKLREADGFRFANELLAWIETDADCRVVAQGSTGRGHIGSTTLRLGSREVTFEAVMLPDLSSEPEVGEMQARFVQTAGGRTGAPMPRRVDRFPFVQIAAPVAWTTLALTIHADGRAEPELIGASSFPRHWVYDDSGEVVMKSGLIDFDVWSKEAFAERTPLGRPRHAGHRRARRLGG